MRFDIELQIKGLRCLKGLFNTLNKVLFSSKEKANIFLVYFLQSKQIRFLVNSENCLAILAIDPRISISNKSSIKQGSQLLVIEFKQGETMLNTLCEIVQKQEIGDVFMILGKDKLTGNEQPFRSLNLVSSNLKYRIQVFKPLYDPETIINHEWLNGCSSSQLRKVEFDIDTQHLLNILRVVVRHKQAQSTEKFVRLIFQFSTERVLTKLEKLKHNSFGKITYFTFGAQKYKGDYSFNIKTQNAAKVYEMFQRKSSGSKMFIDTQNRIVFSYYQEGVFESQVLIKEWITYDSFEKEDHRSSQTKMEV